MAIFSDTESGSFRGLLRYWRQKRRMSQLDLSLSSGVSQRHISFLESGRAKPSRDMIVQLSETLEVPLRERNDWLLAAGFAPLYKDRPLDDPQMSQVMKAVHMILANHEPYPAVAIDRAWNIRLGNRPFEMLADLLGTDVWAQIGGPQRNLLRLLFHPAGLRPFIANWSAAAPLLWLRATREARAIGGRDTTEILDELRPFQDPQTLHCTDGAPLLPVMPFVIDKHGIRVSLFTVIATFGTAQDVTTDELRIEMMFPADEETETLFRSAVSNGNTTR